MDEEGGIYDKDVPYKYRVNGINRNSSIADVFSRSSKSIDTAGTTIPSTFICDDKFEVIVNALTTRGWIRCFDYDIIPSTCKLIFRNLSNIKFPAVFDRYVNHMRNSQHLSNKALLAYHLRGANHHLIQPLTWSSAFEDLSTLIGKALLNSITCVLVTSDHGEIEMNNIYDKFHAVYQALRMDSEWLHSAECCMIDELLKDRISFVRKTISLETLETNCLYVSKDWGGYNDIWIVKPVGSSCGDSVLPVKGLIQLMQTISSMNHKCVVQKYIERPFLLSGRKFDIRQWVTPSLIFFFFFLHVFYLFSFSVYFPYGIHLLF